ncbi:MAG TPA: hypothetical protein VII51_00890 [Gaiellaceae bacterium]
MVGVRGRFALWLVAAAAVGATPAGAIAAAVPGPVDTTVPSVSGVPQQGQRLGAAPGIWTATGTPTYAYQWYRCDATGAHCLSVHGATAVGYKLGAADVGKLIGLTVKATDTSGAASAYASLIGPIAATTAALRSTVEPKISGGSAVGVAATVDDGTWSATPTAYVYAWQRCNPNGRVCVPIAGATTGGYTPVAADVGHALVAVVTATAASGSQTVWSIATRAVKAQPGPSLSAAPAVSGTVAQGQRLTATSGTWAGAGTLAYAYQWYRCDATGAHCNAVHGATLATYTLVAADAGQTIGLTVRATDSTGTATAYAGLVGTVASRTSPLHNTAPPQITGTATVGQQLTATSGTWNVATSSATYSWQRCNVNGRICAPIVGATGSTYTATAGDAGHTLVVVVTAVAAGAAQASWSLATAAVSAT